MSLDTHLVGLARPALVETVYLVGRYLSHRLTRELFLRQLKADVAVPDRDVAISTALDIVGDIERREGAPIDALSSETRSLYANELDQVLERQIEASAEMADEAEVEETFSAIRRSS